jgi:hypothetical protein
LQEGEFAANGLFDLLACFSGENQLSQRGAQGLAEFGLVDGMGCSG